MRIACGRPFRPCSPPAPLIPSPATLNCGVIPPSLRGLKRDSPSVTFTKPSRPSAASTTRNPNASSWRCMVLRRSGSSSITRIVRGQTAVEAMAGYFPWVAGRTRARRARYAAGGGDDDKRGGRGMLRDRVSARGGPRSKRGGPSVTRARRSRAVDLPRLMRCGLCAVNPDDGLLPADGAFLQGNSLKPSRHSPQGGRWNAAPPGSSHEDSPAQGRVRVA